MGQCRLAVEVAEILELSMVGGIRRRTREFRLHGAFQGRQFVGHGYPYGGPVEAMVFVPANVSGRRPVTGMCGLWYK